MYISTATKLVVRFKERTFIPYIIVKSKSQSITTLNAVQSNMSCLLIIITLSQIIHTVHLWSFLFILLNAFLVLV